jgi:hypothetical protein
MKNATELSSVLNASGLRVLQENNDARAHRGGDGAVVRPMPFFRAGYILCFVWEPYISLLYGFFV